MHIIAVDDDRDNLEPLGLLLEMAGYTVELATSGAEAIARARARRPDVVVLDLGLPDMPGEAVTAALKASAMPPVVIAYSGFHNRESAARGAGCDAFVLKPGFDQLRGMLSDLAAPGLRR